MTMNAVEQFVINNLTGFQSPVETSPIEVLHVPPPIDQFTGLGTFVYVWSDHVDIKRFTTKRFAGNPTGKYGTYSVNIHCVQWYSANAQTTAEEAALQRYFIVTVESIANIFAGKDSSILVTLPVAITDPDTNEGSSIVSIGEQYTIEQDYPSLLQEQGAYFRQGLITLAVEEMQEG